MNIIKKVMVFVMGVVVIGVVATTVGVVTQSKNVEKSVTFELLSSDDLAFNVHSKISGYAILNNDGTINNLTSVIIDNFDYNYSVITYDSNGYYDLEIDGDPFLAITSDNKYITQVLSVGNVVIFTFDVEVSTPIFVKTLILLIPLVLSASLIGYLAIKKGDE